MQDKLTFEVNKQLTDSSIALINEIRSFANITGACCVVENDVNYETEYELNPAGHVSFVYDKDNGDKPTCFLFSMELEHNGNSMRRIVITSVKRDFEDIVFVVHGYMGGEETPVSVLIIRLKEDDEMLLKYNWAEWKKNDDPKCYPESRDGWVEIK